MSSTHVERAWVYTLLGSSVRATWGRGPVPGPIALALAVVRQLLDEHPRPIHRCIIVQLLKATWPCVRERGRAGTPRMLSSVLCWHVMAYVSRWHVSASFEGRIFFLGFTLRV